MNDNTQNISEETKLPQEVQNKTESEVKQVPEGEKQQESVEDPNWRAFREARKKDRAEKEAAERRAAEKEQEVAALKAAMEAAFAKSAPAQHQQQNEYYEETEDQRIEKKVQAAIAEREEAAERIRQQREIQEYPDRLRQAYPDFNAVVSSDHLDYLEYHYPEVAGPLRRLPDDFNKWADIYRAVKKFVPNIDSARKEQSRANENFNKPRSMSSTTVTQPTDSPGNMRLSDERKAANWERMQKLLKGVG